MVPICCIVPYHRRPNQGGVLVQVSGDIGARATNLTGLGRLVAAAISVLDTRALTTNLTGFGRMIGRLYNCMV